MTDSIAFVVIAVDVGIALVAFVVIAIDVGIVLVALDAITVVVELTLGERVVAVAGSTM